MSTALQKRVHSQAVQRSVESLQQVYAFVVALAFAQAIEATFIQGGELVFLPERLPLFVAFIVTAVPFFHGMNRHLDRCYVEKQIESKQTALLFDFIVFFVEAGLLFALAASARSGLFGFLLLAALLVLDTVWGLLAHWIHSEEKSRKDFSAGTVRWAMVNAVTVVVIVLIYFLDLYDADVKMWILALIAVVRTVADYASSWTFYFPPLASSSQS